MQAYIYSTINAEWVMPYFVYMLDDLESYAIDLAFWVSVNPDKASADLTRRAACAETVTSYRFKSSIIEFINAAAVEDVA